MKRIICLLIALAAPLAVALTPVGTAFTYQGQLKENGVPVNTTTGQFEFKLFDADVGGNQIGGTVALTNVNVSNGLFTVSLDFGATAFDGEARWLEIRVFKSGTGWITLAPRQRVAPAPYALFALNGGSGFTLPYDGTVVTDGVAFGLHAHLNQNPEGGTTVLAEHTGDWSTAISGKATGVVGIAVSGQASGDAGIGVMGGATGDQGNGVYAWATGAEAIAVYGVGSENASAAGKFVGAGEANKGVDALAYGSTGRAINALAAATTGVNYGIWGQSNSISGTGVYGYGAATSGVNFGVTGVAGSPWGTGVFGLANAVSGSPVGVYGRADAPEGWAGHFIGRGYFSGNVGIGTTSPATKLDVAGTVKASGIQLTTGPTAGYVLTCDAAGNGSWQAPTGGGESFWEPSANGIYYYGNVGIGEDEPAYPLHLVGASSTLLFVDSAATGGSPMAIHGSIATGGGYAVVGANNATTGSGAGVYGASSSPMGKGVWGYNSMGGWAGYFAGNGYFSGNVGIGTTSPTAPLHVNGTLLTSGFQLGSSAISGHVLTCDANGVGTWQAVTGGDSLWQTGAGGVIYYSGGDVGIGTNTPDADLHVATSSAVRGIHVTGALTGVIGEGTQTGVRGEGGNYGVSGEGTIIGVSGYCAGSGRGIQATSDSGIGAKVMGGGAGTAFPALQVLANNAAGIGIYSVSTSTDANAVLVNKGTGDIIKGFSGATGGDLVFRVQNDGTTKVKVLEISGGSDLAERFDLSDPAEAGMVVEIDPDSPGKLRICRGAYNQRVAGVISGARDVTAGMLLADLPGSANPQPVALSGRVWTHCDATERAIEPGDLLTTAERPGHAMPVTDPTRANGAVIGKAMSRLEKGSTGLVLVLINLQ